MNSSSAFFPEENGAPIRRNHLQNGFKQLHLERFQAADGVDPGTDFQQRIEMTGQSSRPRSLGQESFGMKIDSIFPSELNLRPGEQIRIPELDQAVRGNRLGFLEQERGKSNRLS